MSQESRVSKSIKNAKVSTLFYFVFLFLSFFSRKIFLDHLGPDFIGLAGTLGSILGFLSLAELGVGTATAYNLYKPIQQENHKKINELVTVFGYLYRKIGYFILLIGIAFSLSFPFIFKDIALPISLVYFSFFSLLFSSLIGYFINYRQILLTADQKGYVVTAYLQGANFVKVCIQMLLALYWGNLYLWVGIEFLFSIIACLILNYKISKEYPWLKEEKARGRELLKNNVQLVSNIKQLFIHKLGTFVLFQSDQILIYTFVSLKMVAFYGNYTLIITKLSQAVGSALNSFGAGIGNLVAEGNKEKINNVFWELMSIRFYIAGVIVFCTYHLIEPFISIWLGPSYILNNNILILLLATVFIDQTRGAVDLYKEAYGLFADTWSPVCEITINLTVAFCTAPFMGVAGLLLGKIASNLVIVILWRPYYLFSKGLKQNVLSYWWGYIRYMLCFVVSFILCHAIIISYIPMFNNGLTGWITNGIIVFSLFGVCYFISMYIITSGTKSFAKRLVEIAIHKTK